MEGFSHLVAKIGISLSGHNTIKASSEANLDESHHYTFYRKSRQMLDSLTAIRLSGKRLNTWHKRAKQTGQLCNSFCLFTDH